MPNMKAATTILGLLATTALTLTLPSPSQAAAYPAVTAKRLLNAETDNGWLMYRRAYNGEGYVPFKQITPKNVSALKQVFSYKTGLTQGHEGAPIINGRYMFITTPMDHLIALDAVTGKVLWTYVPNISKKALKTVCCDVVNRGAAVYGDNVYLAQLDNHVVALNAKTGKVVWNKQLIAPGIGYALTIAPLALDGNVLVGESGGEYGARDFIAALNAKTGALVWKRFTVPAPGQKGGDTWPKGMYKHGGGSAWQTGTYDPETKTLFWGVGNPAPWLATLRPGKNLFTDSVIALNPKTGAIKWHYQYTSNDTWDYDGNNQDVLADITWKGKKVKALLHADRNGYFYALNRVNGKFLYAADFVKALSVTGHTPDGAPIENAKVRPNIGKKIFTCPSFLGGKNWWPIAVDPNRDLAFVPTLHACMNMDGTHVAYLAGLPYLGETFHIVPEPGSKGWGEVQAIDINNGKQVWSDKTKLPWNDGMLATATGLVFSGSADGHFDAFNSKTGKILWSSPQMSSGIIGVPVSYKVDGKQYVAVYSGWGGATPIWGGDMAKDPAVAKIARGGELHVFALSK